MKNLNVLCFILLVSLGTMVLFPAPAQQKTLDLGAFTGVKLGLPVDLLISQGSPQKVVLEGPGEIADHIKTKIHEGNLYIVKKDGDSEWWKKWKGKGGKAKIHITAPDIKNLAVSGSGNIRSENTLRTARMNVAVSGSGSVKVVVDASDLVDGKVSGSGTLGLRGKAENVKFRVSGSGNLNAEKLAAKNCQIESSGSGNCRIQVTNNLMSRISGSGQVYYRGNPKRIVNNASGSGGLKKIG